MKHLIALATLSLVSCGAYEDVSTVVWCAQHCDEVAENAQEMDTEPIETWAVESAQAAERLAQDVQDIAQDLRDLRDEIERLQLVINDLDFDSMSALEISNFIVLQIDYWQSNRCGKKCNWARKVYSNF